MPVPVSLVEIVESGVREGLASVHTSHPGQVVTYYPATQTADVKPLRKKRILCGIIDGGKVYEDLPIIPNVPVQFPRGSGYTIYVPLGAGDFVWLVFSEDQHGRGAHHGPGERTRSIRAGTLSRTPWRSPVRFRT
jgi:hypothetical protein